MSVSRVEYMKSMLPLSKVHCMWPKWKTGFLFSAFYYTVMFIVSGSILLNLVLMTIKIVTTFENMDGIATVIDFATLYASSLFRYIYIFFRGAAHHRIIENMNNNFIYESFNLGTKANMKASQILGKRLVSAYACSASFVLQMVLQPFYALYTDPEVSQLPFIFEAWYPFNSTAEPNHSIVFTVQAFSWVMTCYNYVVSDTFWYMVIILTIGQIQMITHSYAHLVPPCSKHDENIELPTNTHEVMIKCVRQHQFIRRYIADIEDILSPIIFVDFLHAVLSITFLLLDITIALMKSEWMKMFHLIEYLLVSILHMFIFDYLGNELVLQEEKMARAMYSIPWYQSSNSLAPQLLLTTMASRHPIRLTGGKFYNLTCDIFVMKMRTIFSYFMVLYQLRYEE